MLPSTPVAIGPYRVVRELGRGGMGVVYEVQDPSAPRTLALKRILPGEAGPEALARFTREAQLLAKLRHPNVVTVHSLGQVDGAPYLVTDLVVGRDLKALVRGGGLEPRRAAELTRALADAVAALHRQGVLHRDLKPENVLVREDGAPVLLDFGLAREVDAATLTRTGDMVGTPAYMAPEQLDGPRGADERADVYGLGATLFFLLAGRPPFEGSAIEVLARLATRDPVWPRATRPDLPADLEAICRAAMARDRDARTATADLLRDDLDRWLRGARPLAAVASGARSLRRAVLAALAGVVALAVVVAVAVEVAPGRSPTEPTRPSMSVPVSTVAPRPPARPRPEGAGGLKRGQPKLLEEHRARWTAGRSAASPRPLMTVIEPSVDASFVAVAHPRWLDAHTLLIVRDTLEAPDVRRVSLRSDGPDTATWSGLVHAPSAAAAPADDHVRAAAVVRGTRGPAVVLTGDSQTIALVDSSTPPGGRLAARWSVPSEWTGAAAKAHSVTGDVGPAFDLYAVAAASDGRTVAVGGDWRRVWLIDLERQAPDRHLVASPTEPAHVEDLDFSPDGRRLAVVRSHKSIPRTDDALLHDYVPWRVEVWAVDGAEPRLIAHREEHGSPQRPRAVAWAAGLLVVGHNTGGITTWRVGPAPELESVGVAQLPGDPDETLGAGLDVKDLVTAPDGRTVYVASQRRVAALVPETGAFPWTSDPLQRPSMSLDVSPDGALLAVGDDGGGVTLWAAPPPRH